MNYYETTNASLQISFAKMPKFLFTDEQYTLLSNDSKLLYSLLLDRHSLSTKNKDIFCDENGIYILFPREKMAAALHCSRQKAGRLMAELTIAGLIRERRMGLNKANRIYVQEYLANSNQTNDSSDIIHSECYNIEHPDVTTLDHQEVTQYNINNTDYSHTDMTDIHPLNKQQYLQTIESIKKQIDFDDCCALADEYKLKQVQSLINVMVDVYTTQNLTLRINREHMGIDLIRWKYQKIDQACIDYVIECLDNSYTELKDIRSYLRTALYNAPDTVNIYYTKNAAYGY